MKQNMRALVELMKEKYLAYRFRVTLRKYSRQSKNVSMLCELCYMNGRVGGH
jgi:hypothetical protein